MKQTPGNGRLFFHEIFNRTYNMFINNMVLKKILLNPLLILKEYRILAT